MTLRSALVVTGLAALVGGSAVAEPVAVEVLLEPQEHMMFEFADGSNHFVMMARREGIAEGSGVFAGATVTEIGWHDVNPPVSGSPQGYLQITTEEGDVAVLRWLAQAVFTRGEDQPNLVNQGIWELTSGTGRFAEQRGLGSLVIRPTQGTSIFVIEGEVGERP